MSQSNGGLPIPVSSQEPTQPPSRENEPPRTYGQPHMMSSQATRESSQQQFPTSTVMPSQNTNRLTRIWRSYDEMDAEARRIADDLLGTLAAFNDQQLTCNETVRKNFFNQWVFASGWDTNCMVYEPRKIRNRTAAECSVHVGTIKPGMPRSDARVKKNQETPTHRLPGQPVFLKPNPNWDDYGISFMYCDIRGSIIHSHYVELTPGYSSYSLGLTPCYVGIWQNASGSPNITQSWLPTGPAADLSTGSRIDSQALSNCLVLGDPAGLYLDWRTTRSWRSFGPAVW